MWSLILTSLEEVMKDNGWFWNGKIQETCDNIFQETIVDEVIDYVYETVGDESILDECSEDKVFDKMPKRFCDETQVNIEKSEIGHEIQETSRYENDNGMFENVIGSLNQILSIQESFEDDFLNQDMEVVIEVNDDDVNKSGKEPVIISKTKNMMGEDIKKYHWPPFIKIRDVVDIAFIKPKEIGRLGIDSTFMEMFEWKPGWQYGWVENLSIILHNSNEFFTLEKLGTDFIQVEYGDFVDSFNSQIKLEYFNIQDGSCYAYWVGKLMFKYKKMVSQDRLRGVMQDSRSSLRQSYGGIKRSVLFTMVNGEELVYVNWDMRSDKEFLFDLNSSQKIVKYPVPNKDAKLGCSNVLQDVSVMMGSITLYQVMANYNCKKCGLSSFATVYEHAKEVSCVNDFEVKARNPYEIGKMAESEISIPNNFMSVVQQAALGRLPMLKVIKIVVGAEHTVGITEDYVFYGSGWGRYGYMSFTIWTHQKLIFQSDGYDIWMVLRLDVTTGEILGYDTNIFNEFAQLSWTYLIKSMLLIPFALDYTKTHSDKVAQDFSQFGYDSFD